MFTIYRIIGCPYCDNSINLFKKQKIDYKDIVVNEKDKEKGGYSYFNLQRYISHLFIKE